VRIIVIISKTTNYVATVLLAIMGLLTVADVTGRYIFKYPIIGTAELSSLLILSICALGLAWTSVKREHLKVDLFFKYLPERLQAAIDSVTLTAGLAMAVLLAWRTLLEAMAQQRIVATSGLLRIPVYPFYLILAFGFAMLCIIMAYHVVTDVRKAVKK